MIGWGFGGGTRSGDGEAREVARIAVCFFLLEGIVGMSSPASSQANKPTGEQANKPTGDWQEISGTKGKLLTTFDYHDSNAPIKIELPTCGSPSDCCRRAAGSDGAVGICPRHAARRANRRCAIQSLLGR